MGNFTYSVLDARFILAYQVTVGSVCVLSVLGCVLIICTYAFFPHLRTTARQLLVNLSVADILTSAAHLVGLIANFQRFLDLGEPNNEELLHVETSGARTGFAARQWSWEGSNQSIDDDLNNSSSWDDPLCLTQAAASMFGNISSFLWTLAIAVNMLVLVASAGLGRWRRRKAADNITLGLTYLICWGTALAITMALLVQGYLGFGGTKVYYVGWCYLEADPGKDGIFGGFREYTIILSYDLWNYCLVLLLPPLYIIIYYCVRKRRAELLRSTYDSSARIRVETDLKLLLIPVIFLFLRSWTAVMGAIVYYLNADKQKQFAASGAFPFLVMAEGIGLNAQGLANSILFCLFTKPVRQTLLTACYNRCCHCLGLLCCYRNNYEALGSNNSQGARDGGGARGGARDRSHTMSTEYISTTTPTTTMLTSELTEVTSYNGNTRRLD